MSSKYKIILLVFSFLIVCPASLALANNLVISNVTLEDRNASANTVVVQFDISWDHSWRKNDGRHDAVWVFVKIFQNSTAPWVHGYLNTPGTDPVDTSPGTNPDLKIVIPADDNFSGYVQVGAFISRKTTGSGTFSSKKVRLTVNYGDNFIGDTDTIQVKVFGIEMVYIPEGPFYIGDGNGSQESTYAFHLNGADNTAVQITTAAKSITVDSNGNDDIDTSPITVTGLSGITGNTSWPNGYAAFYLMKYELTQKQYVDFLNTLSRVQQGNRVQSTVSGNTIANYYVMVGSTTVPDDGSGYIHRNSIRAPASGNGTSPTVIVFGNDYNANGVFNESDDGGSLPMKDTNAMDIAAYADWAGLRPYTELEFEKACRGPNPAIYGEYAWGSTAITMVTSILNPGRETEVAGNSGEGITATYADDFWPLRVGFSATAATNRRSAGAGYYGHMNLGDNMHEQQVTLGENYGRGFAGTHGDGTLTNTASYEGNATNNDWPGINATTARGVTGYAGYWAYRHEPEVPMSNRGMTGEYIVGRQPSFGGRLARTAP